MGSIQKPDKERQARALRTRQKLLDTGLILFAEKGYHSVSTKQITKAAGVATGNFYNYFKDKKDLLMTIMRESIKGMHQRVVEEMEKTDWKRAGTRKIMGRIIDLSMELHSLHPNFHREVTMLRYSDPDIRGIAEEEESRMLESLKKVFAQKAEYLKVRDLDAALKLAVLAMEEIIHSVTLFPSVIGRERVAAELLDMMHAYLFKEGSER